MAIKSNPNRRTDVKKRVLSYIGGRWKDWGVIIRWMGKRSTINDVLSPLKRKANRWSRAIHDRRSPSWHGISGPRASKVVRKLTQLHPPLWFRDPRPATLAVCQHHPVRHHHLVCDSLLKAALKVNCICPCGETMIKQERFLSRNDAKRWCGLGGGRKWKEGRFRAQMLIWVVIINASLLAPWG